MKFSALIVTLATACIITACAAEKNIETSNENAKAESALISESSASEVIGDQSIEVTKAVEDLGSIEITENNTEEVVRSSATEAEIKESAAPKMPVQATEAEQAVIPAQ